MRYLINNSTDPYFNLAFDEYCLENIHSEEPYFFLWRNRPAVIIGLNQNAYGEVNLEYLNANGITLARRVTGGGAVYHDLQNMNYTIIGRNPSPQPMVDALRQLGVPAELTGRNDIFVEGRKVSGYARRVAGNQEIIHGTLMYDVDLDTLQHVLDTPASKMKVKGISSVRSHVANLKEYLPQFKSLDELQAKLSEILSGGDGPLLAQGSGYPNQDVIDAEVRRIAAEKFATWEFIYGHSHEADFNYKKKLPCGTVEASLRIDRGTITALTFSGDFLFDEPSEDLAKKLIGLRYDKATLSAAIEKAGAGKYFRSANASQICSLLLGE
ncbi:MAG: lipoate--protein ligase [Bacteroidales bacterium]|nr:lipoate--protein ligase [Bacteroidales bacterium]MEE3390788.1 lipoate--protein ligase [Candidatus Cryptobacteroides sp.]MCH3939931.1 lipoate--protein ligase [Bacteroidales bacterium]MCI2135257.1 lipoate--protein ligase [Bacteroidales bacterium]MDY6320201.1 lipoate--protein ligase [Bacteroidales bacterium]